MVQPLLDFCLNEPERVISIEVTDAQAKEGVVKVTIIIIIIIIVCHLPYHHISKTKIIIIWCLVCHWPPFACWARMWGCPCICLLVLLPSIIILLLMDNIFILMVIIIIFMVIIVVLMVMNMVSMNCWCYVDNYHIMITTSILCYQSTATHSPSRPSCAGCLWRQSGHSWPCTGCSTFSSSISTTFWNSPAGLLILRSGQKNERFRTDSSWCYHFFQKMSANGIKCQWQQNEKMSIFRSGQESWSCDDRLQNHESHQNLWENLLLYYDYQGWK